MSGAKKIMMGGGAVDAYEIEQSLIVDHVGSGALVRTPSSASNRKTWTWSGWVKRSETSSASNQHYFLFSADGNSDHSYMIFYEDKLFIEDYDASVSRKWLLNTNRLFRDFGAWYHIVLAVDTTQGTASNRLKLYVNGVQETSFATATYPAQNYDGFVNTTLEHTVGNGFNNAANLNLGGYLAEVHFIDGTALTPSSFGETNEDTGQWIPKEYTGGSYGTNGFYQKYEQGGATDNPFLFEDDFTIEMFFKLTSMQVAGGYSYPCLLWLPPHNGVAAGGNQGYKLQVNNANAGYQLYMYAEEPDTFDASWGGSGANSIALNTWYHIAVVREGMGSNNLSTYMNGTRRWQGTYTGPVGSIGNTAYIGASGRNYGNWAGYINNLRIVKGTAVYSGSSYTTPTSNLTAISGTSLLALQGSGITDRLPASAPTLTAYDTGGGGHTPIIQSSISGTVGTYTGLFYKDGYNNGNGGGISFNVPGSIGKDSSGNSNDFTGASLFNADVVIDSPTNNFATWNSLVPSTNTFSEGNLKATMSGSSGAKIVSTIGATTGKYYMELLWQNQSNWPVGLTSTNKRQAALSGVSDGSTSIGFWIGSSNTVLYINTSVTSWSGSGTGWSNNDMVGLAVDGVNQTISIYKNGSSIGSYDYSGLGWNQTFFAAGNYVNNNTYLANFGQNPTHSGAISAGSATDGNGIGLFKNAPPSGFLALCTANLPEPAIPLPSENFNTVVWTGNSTDNRVIPVGFAADLTWFKQRTGANWHGLLDTVRGNSNPNVIHSNATNVEGDWTYIFKGHTSTGFTVGTDAAVNANSNTYVAWNWKANGSGSTNNDGNQASSVSANQAAGFSIATFTGTGSYATYGHGLGVIPEVTLTKSRSASGDWYWVTTAIDGSVDYLVLNTTAAAANGSATASTSSVFYSNYPNNQTVVAYNFASKPGYSSIGIFTGNGSNTGPFVNCGFRPAWLLIKLTSASGDHDWFIVDNKRDPDNFLDRLLSPNLNAAEGQADPPLADFLSNGFKIRASSASINGDGATILYMAFAESPFKYANAR